MFFVKICSCLFYVTGLVSSAFFLQQTLFLGNDFYIHKNLQTAVFFQNQKNHIYSKKLDPKLTWQEKTKKDHVLQEWQKVWFFDDYLEEQKIYQFISDHTFKLSNPCSSGTGWILDFEIPNTKDKYPTKWYIATNMHVINKLKFMQNPYNVSLPLSETTKFTDVFVTNSELNNNENYQKCIESFNKAELEIILEKTTIKVGESFILQNNHNEKKFVKNKSENLKEIVKPKLFFHALNFLGPRNYKNNWIWKNYDHYHKDFAILEIVFDNEKQAKQITDDFYGKYYANDNSEKRPINVFSKELISSVANHEELWEKKGFYTGGYPENWGFTWNLDKNKKTDQIWETNLDITNELSYEINKKPLHKILLNKFNEPIIGHVMPSEKYGISWNNKNIERWGYSYAIKNLDLYTGASGSMVIDKNKNLIGIASRSELIQNVGFVDPLISEGIFDGSKIISPKFDLIRGVEGQNMSYKSQLEKYHPKMNTYLKSIGWKTTNN